MIPYLFAYAPEFISKYSVSPSEDCTLDLVFVFSIKIAFIIFFGIRFYRYLLTVRIYLLFNLLFLKQF